MFRTVLLISFAWLLAVSPVRSAFGSTVLILKDGGTLEGELLNPDEINRKLYRVKTTEGLEISLDAKVVDRIQNRERPALVEYNVAAPLTENSLENHIYWAKWCHDRQLPDQAKVHGQQILVFDSDNAYARSLLGFVKNPKDPTDWVFQQDKRENRGLIEHKGRWKTEYQIQIEKMLEEKEEVARNWQRTVRSLCQRLPNIQAETELLAIRDPAAIDALGETLRAEANPQKRKVLLRSLVQICHPTALHIVAAWSISINEPSEDIRLMCVEELRKRIGERPETRSIMINTYRSCLRTDMLPVIIRMAAKTLGEIEGYEAIPELIEVLAYTVVESYQDPQQPYTFGPGGTGFSQGGGQRKRQIPVQNQEVLTALRRLTGRDFGFNKDAWSEWYRQTQRSPAPAANLRRL